MYYTYLLLLVFFDLQSRSSTPSTIVKSRSSSSIYNICSSHPYLPNTISKVSALWNNIFTMAERHVYWLRDIFSLEEAYLGWRSVLFGLTNRADFQQTIAIMDVSEAWDIFPGNYNIHKR